VQGGQEKEPDPEDVRTQGAAIVEAKDICELHHLRLAHAEADIAVTELQTHIDWAAQHTGFAKRAMGGAETKTSYTKKASSLPQLRSSDSSAHEA
jgi:hypothetical protein